MMTSLWLRLSGLLLFGSFVLACVNATTFAGYPNNINDREDGIADLTVTGVTEWRVSQPYINLWVINRPVTYFTSYDKPMGMTVAFRQRDSVYWTCLAGVGHGWAPGWQISCVSYLLFSGSQNFPCTLYPGLGGAR